MVAMEPLLKGTSFPLSSMMLTEIAPSDSIMVISPPSMPMKSPGMLSGDAPGSTSVNVTMTSLAVLSISPASNITMAVEPAMLTLPPAAGSTISMVPTGSSEAETMDVCPSRMSTTRMLVS